MTSVNPHLIKHYMRKRTSSRALFGFLIFIFGVYYVLVLSGKVKILPIIPQNVISWVLAIGCIVGGFYMMFAKLFRHPLYD